MVTSGEENSQVGRRPAQPSHTTPAGGSDCGPERLPPAAASPQALGQEAVVTEDGPHPLDELEPSPPRRCIVVPAGRATRVPQATVTSGIQRSVTVTRRRSLIGPSAPDLENRGSPKLHGMQGVKRVGLG